MLVQYLNTICFALVLRSALAAPHANDVGSNLQFLYQNNLYWPDAQDHNSTILLDTASSHPEALTACAKLKEGLLSTSGKYFDSDLSSLVQYLEYNKQAFPKQKFWVASQNSSDCQTYSLESGLETAACNSRFATFCAQSAPYRPNTDTDHNPDYGVQIQSGKVTFVGFAYSKPYTTPDPVILPAAFYGPACPQSGTGKEDCLFLNVYTPYIPKNPADALIKRKLKPVLVWIHGGGYTVGQSDSSLYDGGNMASRNDLVYVSFNYRLGTLGFLALDDGIINGNFGIGDMVTALQWVHDNIAAFGGDPSRVTIYGESAGGSGVRALLSSPPAIGLFAGAIAQSTPGGYYPASMFIDFQSVADEYNNVDAPFVKSVNCTKSTNTEVLKCLRALPVEKISANPLYRGPTVDMTYLTTPRLAVNKQPGPLAPVHVIFGWLRDDGALFSGSLPAENANLTGALTGAGVPPDLATKVVANPDVFPVPSSPNTTLNLFNVTSRVATAGQFACADQAIVISAGNHRAFPSVYAYTFDRTYSAGGFAPPFCSPPKSAEYPDGDPNQPYFRCHGGELYYTAGTLGQDSLPFRDAGDLLLSQTTVDAWGSFARTYDPNPSAAYLAARGYNASAEAFKKAGRWAPITSASKTPLRVLDVELKNVEWRDTEQCKLLGLPATMFDAPMKLKDGHWVEEHDA
ncbi:cholinesterase [Crepidotus variabilis]|uniref:Carboxylic ester hydrolase n=1 Tax=Crepidotus variabilis TaxID=179855 RepID=A0A9P6ECT9_9AGAR|nr:cholinesterase [Crepidotus variabilis]